MVELILNMDIGYRSLKQIFKNIVIVFVSDNLSQKINFIVELAILVLSNFKTGSYLFYMLFDN